MLIVSYGTYSPNRNICRKCKATLSAIPERLVSQWAIRCYECQAINVIEYRIEIIGYRTDEQWQENQTE